ncbi:anti-sigma factor family protein [Usitatibacter palustris]|uniref:Transmembrane transcriptional regulator (Anti-sigma factor RsiW) n=1 Tax=Usitatibacter palustris TaxID=2732487 RepID=A0A6M4HCE3_9PROT|nr:anti-sigma factor [Usitatibacter palustris]QJR16184.1 hypothetical protein DSM104440_03013 [Usitatibacter palustris]
MNEDRLQAWVDGALPEREREAFEAWLRENPEAAQKARKYAELRSLLHHKYDAVLSEPIPASMFLKRPAWLDFARAAVVLAVGIAIGLFTPRQGADAPAPAAANAAAGLSQRAARAHAVYASEVRHPVEVDVSQQDHLVKWLSKRLGTELKVPVLAPEGFDLLGGRLLPGPEGPVAQFMYQDAAGKRLTLYVTARSRTEGPTAFRFSQEGTVSVFYWIDGHWGYALSGEVEKGPLSRVANLVYRQLNP